MPFSVPWPVSWLARRRTPKSTGAIRIPRSRVSDAISRRTASGLQERRSLLAGRPRPSAPPAFCPRRRRDRETLSGFATPARAPRHVPISAEARPLLAIESVYPGHVRPAGRTVHRSGGQLAWPTIRSDRSRGRRRAVSSSFQRDDRRPAVRSMPAAVPADGAETRLQDAPRDPFQALVRHSLQRDPGLLRRARARGPVLPHGRSSGAQPAEAGLPGIVHAGL